MIYIKNTELNMKHIGLIDKCLIKALGKEYSRPRVEVIVDCHDTANVLQAAKKYLTLIR